MKLQEALEYIKNLEQEKNSLQIKNKNLEDRLASQKEALFQQQSYTADLQKELDIIKSFYKEALAERNLSNARLKTAEDEINRLKNYCKLYDVQNTVSEKLETITEQLSEKIKMYEKIFDEIINKNNN